MLSELLAAIATELDRRRIPYMVIGGQAVLAFGEPRLTKDIDVTVGLDTDGLATILAAAERIGLRPLVEPQAFVEETMVLPCEHGASGARVDFVFSQTPYEREALARTRKLTIEGTVVRFACPEDLVIHKTIAGRPRDLEDIRGVLAKQPTLDRALVRTWLERYESLLAVPLLQRFDAIARSVDGEA